MRLQNNKLSSKGIVGKGDYYGSYRDRQPEGGVGKTTLAIHLATAFAAAGRNTVLLDVDPQASAAEWKDARAAEKPPAMAVPASRLAKVLENTKKIGTEVLILDTAPHSEGTALTAARSADLILVPCQPSIMDLRVLRKTAELLEPDGKAAHEVMELYKWASNRVGVSASKAKAAKEKAA